MRTFWDVLGFISFPSWDFIMLRLPLRGNLSTWGVACHGGGGGGGGSGSEEFNVHEIYIDYNNVSYAPFFGDLIFVWW